MKEFEGKKLLVLGSVILEKDIVERAQKMGAYVAVADYYEDSPAKEFADEKVLLDVLDIDAVVEYCKNNEIDGVTTGFLDLLLEPCYEVCKRLDLPYYATPKMISMSTNKSDFKETCKKYGIPVPQTFYTGSNYDDINFCDITYPVFVKPLDASGSRGASVCQNESELINHFEEAKSFSKNKIVIVEEYLLGTEFLLDYIAVDGEYRLLSMFDRYMSDDRDSARNYADLSVAPSKAIDNYLENMNERIVAMFKDLGFTDGLLFLQGHVNGEKITFYEMGCRLGGSFYKLEEDIIGLHPIDMTVRYALTGKMVDDISQISTNVSKFDKYAFSYNCLLGGDDETIANIKGLEKVNQLSSYVGSIQQRKVGSSYKKDSVVDKPLITIYLATDDVNIAKHDIETLNSTVEAYNEDGEPLLMKRINPNDIF